MVEWMLCLGSRIEYGFDTAYIRPGNGAASTAFPWTDSKRTSGSHHVCFSIYSLSMMPDRVVTTPGATRPFADVEYLTTQPNLLHKMAMQ